MLSLILLSSVALVASQQANQFSFRDLCSNTCAKFQGPTGDKCAAACPKFGEQKKLPQFKKISTDGASCVRSCFKTGAENKAGGLRAQWKSGALKECMQKAGCGLPDTFTAKLTEATDKIKTNVATATQKFKDIAKKAREEFASKCPQLCATTEDKVNKLVQEQLGDLPLDSLKTCVDACKADGNTDETKRFAWTKGTTCAVDCFKKSSPKPAANGDRPTLPTVGKDTLSCFTGCLKPADGKQFQLGGLLECSKTCRPAGSANTPAETPNPLLTNNCATCFLNGANNGEQADATQQGITNIFTRCREQCRLNTDALPKPADPADPNADPTNADPTAPKPNFLECAKCAAQSAGNVRACPSCDGLKLPNWGGAQPLPLPGQGDTDPAGEPNTPTDPNNANPGTNLPAFGNFQCTVCKARNGAGFMPNAPVPEACKATCEGRKRDQEAEKPASCADKCAKASTFSFKLKNCDQVPDLSEKLAKFGAVLKMIGCDKQDRKRQTQVEGTATGSVDNDADVFITLIDADAENVTELPEDLDAPVVPSDPNPEDPNPEDPNPEDPNPEDPNPEDPEKPIDGKPKPITDDEAAGSHVMIGAAAALLAFVVAL